MTEWRELTLGEVTTKIGSGATPRGGKRAYRGTGIALIRSMNVFDDGFKLDGLAYIDDAQAAKLQHVEVDRDDVLVNITGASVARCCIAPRSVLPARVNQHVAIIRLRREQANPRFVSAYLTSPEGKGRLLNLASAGATREALTKGMLEKFTIRLPDVLAQDRVAAVLESLDGLIENNRRRVEVLEEMARAIYREWFIKFRYQGHEDVPLVDSPLGPIPDGWPLVPASQVLEINPRVHLPRGTTCRQLTMSDLDERTMNCEPSGWKDSPTGSKFQNGDTLFARITPCLENGKTGFVQALRQEEAACGSTEFIVLRGRLVGPAFTYLLARSDEFRGHAISSMSGASGRQRVRNECFDSLWIPAPPAAIAGSFEHRLEPLFQQSWALHQQTAALASLRDLLLPKLVTGQIDVSDLDLHALTGAAVA